MAVLTVTSRGQVTFRKEVLQHLGIRPGDKIDLELVPGGKGILRPARPDAAIDVFIGLLAKKTNKKATIEQINDAIAAGWSDRK
jgi:AbrB family looped-hinge helix DNA binding protein